MPAPIISGGKGTAEAKIEAMREAGILVADSPAALGSTMVKALQGLMQVTFAPFDQPRRLSYKR